ncbi:MAG: hypothetical protein JWN25_137 [Verrucomicrobiales bacterium]|nr:hypothetical protein [Verrucomicrobiales bacterium]
MKTTALFSILSLGTLVLTAAEPKDDLKSAFDNLNKKANYSWSSKSEIEGLQFTPPTIEGKTEKDGYTLVSVKSDQASAEALSKGTKAVAKTADGWKTAEQMAAAAQAGGGGGFNRATMMPNTAIRAKAPGAEFGPLMGKIKSAKTEGDMISAELTDEGAKELASFGRGRPGGQIPEPKDAKASAKVWTKDGIPNKIEVHVSSKVKFGGPDAEEREFVRTTTIEIKSVGSTTVEAPEDAKKALEAK